MGDLRDQLKKAKLLSDKKARQLAHEERVHRKKVGREGLEKEQSERQAELALHVAQVVPSFDVVGLFLDGGFEALRGFVASLELEQRVAQVEVGLGSVVFFQRALVGVDGRFEPPLFLGDHAAVEPVRRRHRCA